MTEIRRIQCDGCGQESNSQDPMRWLAVNVEVLGLSNKEALKHFCSWECFGRYGAERGIEEKK